MVDPVAIENIFAAALAGAMVIIFGGLYALLFAFAKIRNSSRLRSGAYVSYALLFASTLLLARYLNLDGWWRWIVLVMVVGYLLAPHAIWYLCVGTHREGTPQEPAVTTHNS
ncbi:MAG: hypothetical protein ACR2QU_13040 [Gammaproteobacteria bacterium]